MRRPAEPSPATTGAAWEVEGAARAAGAGEAMAAASGAAKEAWGRSSVASAAAAAAGGGGIAGFLDTFARQQQAQIQAMQRMLQQQGFGTGVGGGGGGNGGNRGRGGGGGGGPGGGTLASGPAPQRAADWRCSGCGFAANFARRQACFQCGMRRGGTSGGGAGGGPQRGAAEASGVRGGGPHLSTGSALRGGRGQASTVGGGALAGTTRGTAAVGPETCPTTRVAPMLGATRPGPPPAGLRPAPSPYRGPVGADGQRPLLAWAGIAAKPPTPAAAQGIGSGANGATRAVSGDGGHGDGGGPVVDADGFRLVQGRPRATRAAAGPAADGTAAPGEAAGRGGDGQRGADDEAPTTAGGADLGAAQDVGGEGTTEGPGDAPQEPTELQLREEHGRHRQLVEYLIQQGFPPDDPVRLAAEDRAEGSKKAWEDAKPGKAVTLRMRWAEEALTRARRSQAKMEQAIDELDREYESKRLDWTRQLGDLRAKTKEREEKLAAVARQAAAEFSSGDDADGNEPLREAAEALETRVTPTFVELLGQIPADSPARQHVEQAVSILKGTQGTVARASRERWADVYDIGEQDDWEWGDGHNHQEEADQGGWWAHQWGGQDQHWGGDHGGGWGYDGWGHQRPRRWMPGRDSAGGDAMDTSEAQAPTWIESGQAGTAYARANKRRACEGDDPNGLQGRHVGEVDECMEEHEGAARLQAAASGTAADSVARPAPPTPTAEEHAALEVRRREAWDLAQDQGIQVSHDTIAGMGSEQLEEWITANLM